MSAGSALNSSEQVSKEAPLSYLQGKAESGLTCSRAPIGLSDIPPSALAVPLGFSNRLDVDGADFFAVGKLPRSSRSSNSFQSSPMSSTTSRTSPCTSASFRIFFNVGGLSSSRCPGKILASYCYYATTATLLQLASAKNFKTICRKDFEKIQSYRSTS